MCILVVGVAACVVGQCATMTTLCDLCAHALACLPSDTCVDEGAPQDAAKAPGLAADGAPDQQLLLQHGSNPFPLRPGWQQVHICARPWLLLVLFCFQDHTIAAAGQQGCQETGTMAAWAEGVGLQVRLDQCALVCSGLRLQMQLFCLVAELPALAGAPATC